MFVSFEGIDGSGKTTQIELLSEKLVEAGYQVVKVREPGGTTLSESIRTLLLDSEEDIAPVAELLLFSAARCQLVERVIKPSIASGAVVIADRFFDSTTAYQGAGRGVSDAAFIDRLNQVATGDLTPQLTFLLRLDNQTARSRRSGDDRMEASGDSFFERVSAAYDHMASEHERFRVVDASQRVSDMHEIIWTEVQARLPKPEEVA